MIDEFNKRTIFSDFLQFELVFYGKVKWMIIKDNILWHLRNLIEFENVFYVISKAIHDSYLKTHAMKTNLVRQ